MTPPDQRASSRRPCSEPAVLSDGQRHWDTRLVNLSDGGACVLLPEGWPDIDPEHLVLGFRIDDQAHRHRCEIAWGDLERLGLEFLAEDGCAAGD